MTSLQELRFNKTSGSSEILIFTIEALRNSFQTGENPAEMMAELNLLCQTHSSMVLLRNLKKCLETKGLSEAVLNSWWDSYREHEESACRRFAAHLEQYNRVLVHSNSGLLNQSFRKMNRKIEVFCTESRPALEGILLAEQLSRTGHRVTIVTDLAAFSVIPEVEALAFGCDALTKRGIVNKIGTSVLASAAIAIGKNTFFVATSEKFAETWEDIFLQHQGSGDQIYTGKEDVSVRNFYYDLTLPEFVSGLFLENGLTQDTFL